MKNGIKSSTFEIDETLQDSSRWLIGIGAAVLILGIAALLMSVATTLISVVVIGVLFFLAAVFQSAFAVTSKRWAGFGLHLLLAVLYGITGFFLMTNPAMGAATLTLLLAFFFFTSGLFRIIASAVMRFSGWGWTMISGIITTGLGLFVMINFPQATLFLLGTLLGIDLIFYGALLLSFGVTIRRELSNRLPPLKHAYQ